LHLRILHGRLLLFFLLRHGTPLVYGLGQKSTEVYGIRAALKRDKQKAVFKNQ
jgi:hypothetical protein